MQIDTCLDYLKCLIGQQVLVHCRENWELKGILNAYDEHINLILSDVQEKDKSEIVNYEVLFVRGDQVIAVESSLKESPQLIINKITNGQIFQKIFHKRIQQNIQLFISCKQ